MIIFNNLPSFFVPLVGLVFPAIAMASLFLYVQKNKIFQIRQVQILSIFFQDLDIDNTDIYLVEYGSFLRTQLLCMRKYMGK